MNAVPGLDVSYWQAEVDWQAVRAAGAQFVFIKATEGAGYTDSTFAEKWAGAKAAGILRGAYCFFHPNQDATQQADRFVSALREQGDDGELPGSIDLEVTDGVPNRKIILGVKTWLDAVEQRLGRRPLIYSGVSFLEFSLTEEGQPPPWAADYALWLGWFPRKYVAGMSPLMPQGWPAWTFWQYSGAGRIRGIDVDVDLDFFNGTAEELTEFANLKKPASTSIAHIVAAGESAESIARKYQLSIEALVTANPQLFRVGEKLTIPGRPVAPVETANRYLVRPGDTLHAIAAKFGTTIAALVDRNKIEDPDLIQIGQVLVLA